MMKLLLRRVIPRLSTDCTKKNTLITLMKCQAKQAHITIIIYIQGVRTKVPFLILVGITPKIYLFITWFL